MHSLRSGASALSFMIIVGAASAALATPIGVDDFEDGTTMGWGVPGPIPVELQPTNVSTGGPDGAGDGYLQLRASGLSGPGGRLSVLNETQWTGDFRAAGITAISMEVNNFGPNDLVLRLLFEDFDIVGPPSNLALTLDGIFVPAGSGWMTVVFSLSPSNLIAALGTVEGALTDVSVMRIFHNPAATFLGPPSSTPLVAATLGVDNITPVGIAAAPEPATGALLISALAGAMLRARRRK